MCHKGQSGIGVIYVAHPVQTQPVCPSIFGVALCPEAVSSGLCRPGDDISPDVSPRAVSGPACGNLQQSFPPLSRVYSLAHGPLGWRQQGGGPYCHLPWGSQTPTLCLHDIQKESQRSLTAGPTIRGSLFLLIIAASPVLAWTPMFQTPAGQAMPCGTSSGHSPLSPTRSSIIWPLSITQMSASNQGLLSPDILTGLQKVPC